jgi:tetratricopeptide (TPR) repeat protein
MSTLKPPKKISRRHELREDKLTTLYAQSWDVFDRHKNVVWGIGLGLLAVILGIAGYFYYLNQQQGRAQELLGESVRLYESGEYRTALDGTETAYGLLTIADDYGNTSAGNLAHFYAGDALFRLGEYDAALEQFEAYDKGDDFLGASAYAGQAAVHEHRGDYEEAGDLYRRAADTFESAAMTPEYLLDAGRAYEKSGDYQEARRAYQAVLDRYPDSRQGTEVGADLSRLEMMQRRNGQ